MDPKINCLKCGSYIHDTNHCWNWHERRLCPTDKKLKESCDCDWCKSKEICKHCNYWLEYCDYISERCSICNEHSINYLGKIKCHWNHTKSPCKFCKLPISACYYSCSNSHDESGLLCKECNMPEPHYGNHAHDGSLCKKCGTLLNHGKCIYQCVNGGKRCICCYSESIVDNMCYLCNKDQTGFLTKAAIK